MNGCLLKILLIITVLVAIFSSYPYFIKYTSESVQTKVSEIETAGIVFKKIIQYLHNNKSKKND
jgi:uncharacterized membrane protein